MSGTVRKPRKTPEERQAAREAEYRRQEEKEKDCERAQQRKWRIDHILERVAGFRYYNASIDNGCIEHNAFRRDVTITCRRCGCPFCTRVVGHSDSCTVLEAEALIREAENPPENSAEGVL